jgi:hypothetical protein
MHPADQRSGANSDDSPLRDAPSGPPSQRRARVREHLPSRPVWDCTTCGRPWPCAPAREGLAAEYVHDFTGLSVLLWNHFEDYSHDAGSGPLGEAYERFMGWSRPLR